jgi:hypothetical protein
MRTDITRLHIETAHLIDKVAMLYMSNQRLRKKKKGVERREESDIILSLGMPIDYQTYHPKHGHVLECLRMHEIGLTGPMFSVRPTTKDGKLNRSVFVMPQIFFPPYEETSSIPMRTFLWQIKYHGEWINMSSAKMCTDTNCKDCETIVPVNDNVHLFHFAGKNDLLDYLKHKTLIQMWKSFLVEETEPTNLSDMPSVRHG